MYILQQGGARWALHVALGVRAVTHTTGGGGYLLLSSSGATIYQVGALCWLDGAWIGLIGLRGDGEAAGV